MLLFNVPDGNLFCGGVGGFDVGAGPAEPWDTFPMLPYGDFPTPGPYWLEFETEPSVPYWLVEGRLLSCLGVAL